MSPQKQTFFLIDGSHYDRLRSVFETPFDLRKLADLASGGVAMDQAIYYRDVRDDNEAERQRSLFGWLKHNGFFLKGRTHGPGEPRERYGTNLVQIAGLCCKFSGKRDAAFRCTDFRRQLPRTAL